MYTSIKEILGFVSVIFVIFGFGSYFISVLRNKTKPHIFTWIIWTIGNFSVFFAQLFNNAGAGAWAVGVSGVMTLAISILCYHKKHHLDTKKNDFIFLFFSLLALFYWYLTANALYTVIILAFVDACGYLPTFKKAFRKPFEENLIGFVMATLRNIASLLSLSEYSIITTLFQTCGTVFNISLITLIIIRRNLYKKTH